MKENLYNLLEIQEIDKEIDVLRRSQQDYPQEIARLKREMGLAQKQIDEKRERLEELERNRRAIERELEAINLDQKKHQDRLYEVKTNREYDALQHEIEALRSRIEEHETTILEAMEESEDLSKKLGEDEEIFEETKKESLARVKELTSYVNSVEENIGKWEKKRGAVEVHIERRPLSVYNRIRRSVKAGVAAVPVEKGSCGGCFRKLAPQRMVEVRRQDQVIRCENCGRILVWKEEVQV